MSPICPCTARSSSRRTTTTTSLEKLNANIEVLLRDDKDYWEEERGRADVQCRL